MFWCRLKNNVQLMLGGVHVTTDTSSNKSFEFFFYIFVNILVSFIDLFLSQETSQTGSISVSSTVNIKLASPSTGWKNRIGCVCEPVSKSRRGIRAAESGAVSTLKRGCWNTQQWQNPPPWNNKTLTNALNKTCTPDVLFFSPFSLSHSGLKCH